MIEGRIESLSPDGVLHGWVRDGEDPAPCHAAVLQGTTIVAEAVAEEFRPDLLRSGCGHGHYGFRARLCQRLDEGPCSLMLTLPRAGLSAPMSVTVPKLAPPDRVTVEMLLQIPPGWTTGDLLEVPTCLNMERNHAAMATPRFVDAVFRFVLGRWPSDAEARHQAASLDGGIVSPTGLLVELLASRERADMPPGLVSPYHPGFPFATS
jgi:hypothetical protein